jgi:hypothetical protein
MSETSKYELGGFSDVNVDSVDLLKFPKIKDVRYSKVTMEAGDCIFVPGGRWLLHMTGADTRGVLGLYTPLSGVILCNLAWLILCNLAWSVYACFVHLACNHSKFWYSCSQVNKASIH